MKKVLLLPVFLMTCASLEVPLVAGEWPGWRGVDQTGISTDKNLPVKFGADENVKWHVPLPEPGNGSPIVWQDRLFISQAIAADHRRTLLCFSRKDGKMLWQSGITYTDPEATQESNPYCAGTPATDGKYVYVCFGAPGVYAYDFEGKEVWHRELGKISHIFGSAVSPVLFHDRCFLNYGPDAKTRLIALDKTTGATLWESEPPKLEPGEDRPMRGPGGPGGPPPGGPGGPGGPPPGAPGGPPPSEFPGPGGPGGPPPGGTRPSGGRGMGRPGGASWSTPMVVTSGGHDELVISFPNRLVAYDPATGKQLWMSKGIGGTVYSSPVWGGGILVAMSGGPGGGGAIAVRPGGSGDVTQTQQVWKLDRVKSTIGSGVIHDDHLYTVSQEGIATCRDLQTGKTVWEERLKGSTSRDGCWSSILMADGKLYIPNQAGDVFVLLAAPKFEVVATNALKEPTNASLAASDSELFLRTQQGLWCFANKNQ